MSLDSVRQTMESKAEAYRCKTCGYLGYRFLSEDLVADTQYQPQGTVGIIRTYQCPACKYELVLAWPESLINDEVLALAKTMHPLGDQIRRVNLDDGK